MDEYPTEEQLKIIENTLPEDFYTLGELVCALWHFPDWATYRPETTDEQGEVYRELRLATAGWSGNESIISALHRNKMFKMICWISSHRGGLFIYHVRKFPKPEQAK